jgi:diguanylate cyclase (GGDEF)-like protein
MSLAPSAHRFPELFPFHLVVDDQLQIRQLGPALARLLGPGACGTSLLDQVHWRRPLLRDVSLEGFDQVTHKLVILELCHLPLQLKGQLLVDGGLAFFLGTPVVHSLEHLSSLGIRLSDIARHDALADALVMLQTKDMTIADLVQRRTQDLERLATQDALTEVGNRLLFNRDLQVELEEHRLQGQPLALLLLDVDHFKRFNDRHGHLAGDACLRAVAERLVSLVGRGGDRVYRYGGEEFAVLLPGTDLSGARQVAGRIVQGFASASLQVVSPQQGVNHQSHSITLSAGLACADPCGREGVVLDETGLIALADEALYQAKHAGRSRFVSLV